MTDDAHDGPGGCGCHRCARASDALAAARQPDFARRIQMYRWTAAEWAIYGAVQIVELVGADVRLTDAVCLLQEAKDRVADYIDGVKPESVYQARADKLAAARAEGAAEAERLREVVKRASNLLDGLPDFGPAISVSDAARLAAAGRILREARSPSSGTEARPDHPGGTEK